MVSPTVASPAGAASSPTTGNGSSKVVADAVAVATRTSLGLSASTQYAQSRAGVIWDYFAPHSGAPKFADINADNMAGEQVNYYFGKQTDMAVSHPIPHNCDANLKPTTNTKKVLGFPTLSNYFGQWAMSLRERLPLHPYLPSRKADPWDFAMPPSTVLVLSTSGT